MPFSSNKLRMDLYNGYALNFIELELSECFPFHGKKKSRNARDLLRSQNVATLILLESQGHDNIRATIDRGSRNCIA